MNRIITAILITSLFLIGCNNKSFNDNSDVSYSLTDYSLDTVNTITIYDNDKDAYNLINKSFNIIHKYENILSKTKKNSDVYKINHSKRAWIKVNKETAYLINISKEYSKITDGYFDISINPLSTLWNIKPGKVFIPDNNKIKRAINNIDYNKIIVKNNKVKLKNPNMSIDLGGIAKGYIADKIKEFLVKNKIKSAIINLGGNILTVGTKPDNNNFNIGLEKPFDNSNYLLTLSIDNLSVVTSGNYFRYFKYKDKIYHHILNPKTGYSPDNNLYSVTIISKSSIEGDALSTSCFLLGLNQGMKLIESKSNCEAIFVDNHYKIYYTSGLTKKDNTIKIKGW